MQQAKMRYLQPSTKSQIISQHKILIYMRKCTMPVELLFELFKWDIVYKSPYGLSFYNAQPQWGFKKDKSLRISDHWNFVTRHTTNVHCKSNIMVPENYWALGQYNSELGHFEILSIHKPIAKTHKTKEFKLLQMDVMYNKVFLEHENFDKFKQQIDFSFLKKYYTILEQYG